MSKFVVVILIAAIAIAFQTMAYADALDDAVEICRNPNWVEGVTAEEVEATLVRDAVKGDAIILTGVSSKKRITANEFAKSQIGFSYRWKIIGQGNTSVFLVKYGEDIFLTLIQRDTSGENPTCSENELRIS